MLNTCTLVGRLGDDPELKFSTDGLPITSLSLGFSCGKDKTGWITVTAFGKLANSLAEYLHRGAKIGVIGRLVQDSWETDSGEKRKTLKLIANSVEFISVNRQPKEGEYDNDNDDLPF